VKWLALAIVAAFAAATPAQEGESGEALFARRCSGCHALDRDKEGPRLGGINGRRAGTVATFEYSAALKGARITWTRTTLDQWLTAPEKLVPGTEMNFRVLGADERRRIVEYLCGGKTGAP
jgi:cytochrome c